MWDFTSPIDSFLEQRMRNTLGLFHLDLMPDHFYGIYTITEAAGYIPPVGGADFVSTYQLSLATMCWLPWRPPKPAAEQEFIISRRERLFQGAAEKIDIRVSIAARVNRPAFNALKNGQIEALPEFPW